MLYDNTRCLTDLLNIRHPIIQDGMGPFGTNEIAVAVSNAGGLGTVSIPGMTRPADEAKRAMRENIEWVAAHTQKPFATNVPVGRLPSGEILPSTAAYIEALIEARKAVVAAEERASVIITSAGFPGEFREAIQDSGLTHLHKVGSTAHAIKAEAAGVDAIIASGYEMGGHTHANPVHTFVLGANVTEKVSVPVVLSGGVRDGRGLVAALGLGANGVAMGTRFIATHENMGWHPAYTSSVLAASEGDDTVFPAVYGPARGLRNSGIEQLLSIIAKDELDDDALARWKDERIIRAQEEGDTENGIMPMGQVASGISEIVGVEELISGMVRTARELLAEPAMDAR